MIIKCPILHAAVLYQNVDIVSTVICPWIQSAAAINFDPPLSIVISLSHLLPFQK